METRFEGLDWVSVGFVRGLRGGNCFDDELVVNAMGMEGSVLVIHAAAATFQ